jgi:CheY-like chemotaxis protein
MKWFGKWRKEVSETVPVAAPGDESFTGGEVTAADTHTPIGQNRKILVVDDNPVVLKAFELKLKTLGFQVITATEGSEAVSSARHERPDLIVLDINFPPDVGSSGLQWDGFNIMQWMQRFQEVSKIPVIIITGSEPEKYRDRALAAGASAFFQKPIQNQEFLMTIRRVLGAAEPKAKAV